MITALITFFKQLFCRHDLIFKESNLLEKRYDIYGYLICRKCGKVKKKMRLGEVGQYKRR